MISRRQLFAGMSLLPFSGGLASCAARATPTPPSSPGSIATVGPHANWNGAALSGSITVAPNDTTGLYTRTSAGKPTARWIQPGGQRLWQDTYIGVAAYAQGGIASVVFKGDCATTTVTASTLRTYTGSDGATKSNYAYWIKLSPALFTAVSGSGTAQIFAEITANNSSMAPRIIGCQNAQPAATALVDWTHIFYPRTTESDFSKTIGPAGADYTSIDAFLNAARAANAEAPKGTFTATGSYSANNGNAGTTGTGNAKGFAVLTAAPGVTATINRAASSYSTTVHDNAYSTFASNPNGWRPGWPGIEFRGPGVILDRQYWNLYSCNGSSWFNGCKVTNSASTGVGKANWRYAYNGRQWNAIGTRDDNNNVVTNFWVDATNEYNGTNCFFEYLVDGVKQRGIDETWFHNNACVINTYGAVADAQTNYLGGTANMGFAVMNLHYIGVGTPTLSFTGCNDAGANTVWNMFLKVNGTTVYTIPITDITGAGPLWVDDLVAYINANCTNWVAAQTPGTQGDYIGARYIGSVTNLPISTNAGSPTALSNSINMHTEWASMQGYPFNVAPLENILHAYNTTNSSVSWNTGIHPFFKMQDVYIINNAFLCTGGPPTGYGGGDSGYFVLNNGVLANNDWDGGLTLGNSTSSSNVVAFLNNVAYWHDSNNTDPAYPAFTNNLLNLGQGIMPNGPNSTGNVQLPGSPLNATGYAATYANRATGNYSPAGAKLTNVFAQTFPYDRNYNARNMSADAAGSSAIGFSEPSRPF